jgi:hypothetical protein
MAEEAVMRVNVINMLRQAADCINPKDDRWGYSFKLGELADHLAGVRDGEHTWAEFAEAYCLTERDRRTP